MANPQTNALPVNDQAVLLRLFLSLFGAAVLSMVLFAVVKGLFKLSGLVLTYPYAIAVLFFVGTLPGFALSRSFKGFERVLTPLPILALGLTVSIGYHLVFLEEDVGDVLYIVRFYFGFFILFYGFAAFLFWLNLGRNTVLSWVKRLTAIVITISFAMAASEVGLRLLGFGPETFPWIQEATLEGLAGIAARGETVPLRAFGLAANSAVLGGFTMFLTAYYYSRRSSAQSATLSPILLMGVATVFLSWSGTGLLLFMVTLLYFFLKHSSSRSTLLKLTLFPLIAGVIFVAILSQTGEQGRLSKDYIDTFSMIFGIVFDFFKDYIVRNLLSPLFGVMNLYQYTKPESQQVLNWGSGNLAGSFLRFYDFAYIALLIELGIVGFLSYLVVFWKLVLRAFGREDYAARWAFLILLIATLHYPVVFWVCSQVMSAAILAAHIYARSKEGAS